VEALLRRVVETRFEDLSPRNVRDVRRRFIDVVGCAVGGSVAGGNEAVSTALRRVGGPGHATVVARGFRLPTGQAAMMNAIQCRSYDFEVSEVDFLQAEQRATGHVCATVDWMALSVGETLCCRGTDILTAAAIGGDLAARLASAEDFEPSRSFDLSGTVTAFGAAAAAGRLLGLDSDQLGHAFGLLPSLISGSFQGVLDGVHAFKLHQGTAAQNALLAVDLAREGFEGVRAPLFGPRGYFAQFTGSHQPEILTRDLTGSLKTQGYHKAYPGCYGNHAALEAALSVASRSPLAPDDIREVVVEIWSDKAGSFLVRPFGAGDSPEKALFNTAYAIASAVVRGGVSLADYDAPAVADPDVLSIAARIRYEPSLPDDWGRGVAARVHVVGFDGTTHSGEVEEARGFPGRPLSDEDLEAKYWANVEHQTNVGTEAAEEALDLLRSFEDLEDVRTVFAFLDGSR